MNDQEIEGLPTITEGKYLQLYMRARSDLARHHKSNHISEGFKTAAHHLIHIAEGAGVDTTLFSKSLKYTHWVNNKDKVLTLGRELARIDQDMAFKLKVPDLSETGMKRSWVNTFRYLASFILVPIEADNQKSWTQMTKALIHLNKVPEDYSIIKIKTALEKRQRYAEAELILYTFRNNGNIFDYAGHDKEEFFNGTSGWAIKRQEAISKLNDQ